MPKQLSIRRVVPDVPSSALSDFHKQRLEEVLGERFGLTLETVLPLRDKFLKDPKSVKLGSQDIVWNGKPVTLFPTEWTAS